MTLLINEYTLMLSTGEKYDISECNVAHNPGVLDIVYSEKKLFVKVPIIPETVVTDAKIGNDKEMMKYLLGSTIGSLAKLEKTNCARKKTCASYHKSCSIPKPIIVLPNLPECWEYEGDSHGAEVMTEIVRHWKMGRRFILVL